MRIIPVEDKLILKQVFKFNKNKRVKLYIVGGYLRDLFLNRIKDAPDIDFCLARGAINFGRKLAARMRAGFVILDKEHGACRVVKKAKGTVYTLDFTDFRGRTFEADLLHRDFTINTLALELGGIFAPVTEPDFVDLYGARQDLKLKSIRVVNDNAFGEDPLRILRAFSLSAIFGFVVDKNTLRLIKRDRELLKRVSSERVRDELFKVLAQDNSYDTFVLLDKLKILSLIIPEIEIMRGVAQGPYHHLDVLKHSFETLRQLELLLRQKKNNFQINNYLEQVVSSGRKRLTLLKLGALLHDIGKPQAKRRKKGKTIFHGHERIGAQISVAIARRLKFSNEEVDSLRRMIFWHLRPGYLADNRNITPRAVFRYFRDAGEEGLSILLLSLADQRSTKGRLTSKESRLQHEVAVAGLLREYFRKQGEKKMPRLLNGDDLIKELKLSPSPLIGRILARLEELQAIGKIRTKDQALREAGRMVNKRGRK